MSRRADIVRSATGVARCLGPALRARSASAWIRSIALFQAAMVLSVALSCLSVTLLLAQERDRRAAELQPVLAQSSQGASLLVSFPRTTVLKDRGVTLIVIWPLTAEAPPPPGVSKWPMPGEAWVSPSVARDLPSGNEVFGRVAGVIEPTGLETPTERRVYVRPLVGVLDKGAMKEAVAWRGGPIDGWWGLGVLNAASRQDVILMFAFCAVFPALVAVAIGSNLDAERRVRRGQLLTLLGARWRDGAAIEVAEAWRAVISGGLVGGLLIAGACTKGIRIERLDFELPQGTIVTAWPRIVAAVILASTVAICVTLFRSTRPTRRTRRLGSQFVGRLPTSRAALCAAAAAGAIALPANTSLPALRTATYFACVAVVATTLPSVMTLIVTGLGSGLAKAAWAKGLVGVFLGARQLAWSPSRTSRLGLAVCCAILLLGQVQLWTNVYNADYDRAVLLRQQIGSSVLQANNSPRGAAFDRLVAQLPHDVAVLWLWREPPVNGRLGRPVIAATCRQLQVMHVQCSLEPADLADLSNTPLVRIARVTALRGEVLIHPLSPSDMADPPSDTAQMFLVSTRDRALPLDSLQRLGLDLMAGGIQLEELGQGWLIQGLLTHIRAAWASLWALLGVLSICVAATLALVADFRSGARRVVPLAALSDRRQWVWGQALCRVSLPITAASILGASAYYLLALGISRSGDIRFAPSLTYALSGLGIGAGVGVLCALPAARSIWRRAATWRPGDQRD